jgi:hypothetical protein
VVFPFPFEDFGKMDYASVVIVAVKIYLSALADESMDDVERDVGRGIGVMAPSLAVFDDD